MKIKPLVERFSGKYWHTEITRAEERFKKFVEAAEESIRVYNAQKQVGILNDTERRLNSWWYCVNTLLPAYFSSTPKAEVTLRKRTGGVVEELTAVGLERNIQYDMDTEFCFADVGRNAALHFLLTGLAVLWARYETEIEDDEVEIALFQLPDGQLVDDQGQPFQGEPLEIKDGPGQLKLVKVQTQKKSEECAILENIQYNDYLCSDARNSYEIEWQARRAFVTRYQAEKLFGEDLADKLNFDQFPDKDKKDWHRGEDQYEGKAEIFEIWCEEAEKVFWGSKSVDEFIFKSGEPPIDFEGFYPCVVIAQNTDPDSIIPVSDYVHVKDQILEVERLTTRIHAVTQAVRTNFAYDSALGPAVEQLMIGDLKGVPMNNWPSYKQRGGLANSIEFLDIQAFVNTLQILQNTRDTALNKLFEFLKVTDLLRGTSEQYKSATANRLEAQWSSLGLIVRQNIFAKFISDGIDKIGQIISSQYNLEKFFDVADMDRMIMAVLPPPPPMPEPDPNMPPEMQPPPPNPELQILAFKQQVINLLRNEDRRCYRIAIASDSMIAIDQAQEQAEGQALMAACGDFFNQMKALIEQYPPLLEFSMTLFQNVVKRFKGGKEVDGIFTKALSQIGEISKAKEEAAKQPPPPDPIMQEMQARMQIAQMESQARIQAAQMDMQDKAAKNQLMYQEQQLKMQRDQLDSQLAIQKQQFDEYMRQQELAIAQQEVQVKANSVQIDALKVQANAENEQAKQAIVQETNRMAQILEIQKLELEQMRMKLSESEKLMEERRLASEQALERVRMQMESINTTKAAVESNPTKQQPIVINNIIPKASRKLGTLGTDALGNTTLSIDNIDED
jgi:hypothetical protein